MLFENSISVVMVLITVLVFVLVYKREKQKTQKAVLTTASIASLGACALLALVTMFIKLIWRVDESAVFKGLFCAAVGYTLCFCLSQVVGGGYKEP